MAKILDTYYFDRERAMEVALQQNRVQIAKEYTVPQLCYYDGEPFVNPPRTLINVPFESIVDFFINTGMRFPAHYEGKDRETMNMGSIFSEVFPPIENIRNESAKCNAGVLSKLKPDFINDRPWRIVFTMSIFTEVWQYCIENVVEEFQKLGFNVKIIQEKDDLHRVDNCILLKSIAEFKPHIIFMISHTPFKFIHPDIYFVSWWQDITPDLRESDKIAWRDKDFIFAQTFTTDKILERTGAKNIMRQGIGVNTDCYRVRPDIKRERKVVFVGSSYINMFNANPGCSGDDDILKVLDELLAVGLPITMDIAEDLGKTYNITPHYIFEKYASYLVRERVIEWLCQRKDIKVEIYGRFWDLNPIVKPFFKGEIPYGEAVAKVYNEAMYGISAVPINITIQRVIEMASCGSIPVLYDCRHIAEKPHWDNECLFFRSKEELYACFDKVPAGNPEDVGKADSYESFAKKITSMIEEREGVLLNP